MPPVDGPGRAGGSLAYRAGLRFVTWWLRLYTGRVDPRIADSREAEVTFELWEFAAVADRRRWSGAHAGTTLVARTVLGMPRDMSWRRAAVRDGIPPNGAPVRLVSRRRRVRFWVPICYGHTFDQTNGVIEPERAVAYERDSGSFGPAGNAFGIQGGF